MNQTFTLQPYKTAKSRYRCPQCNHRGNTFVRYINTQTGQHLADYVGRCGREDKCGYHLKPGEYFKSVDSRWPIVNSSQPRTMDYRPSTMDYPPTYIHPEIVNASFTNYHENNLVQYLITRFGFTVADELVGRYRIGTCSYWPGSTVFWQLDTEGLVRSGKVMLYNRQTGKRVKQPFNHITWAHVLLNAHTADKIQQGAAHFGYHVPTYNIQPATHNFQLQQCIFGEHLLAERPTAHVAIVESEKTALIASAHDAGRIWLAAGSLSNLNPQLCQALKGRTVTLFPDLGAYAKWQAKARYLQTQTGAIFTVSRLLEDTASEQDRANGLDLGDFLG